MSLYIKGLDMPKDTERVEIIFWHSIGEKDEYILQHNLDVEAVEIPTPHGRLIDESLASVNLFKEIMRVFKEESTILEAED